MVANKKKMKKIEFSKCNTQLGFYMLKNSFMLLFTFLAIQLNASAFCKSDKIKILDVNQLHENSFETFSNGKFRIYTGNPDTSIIDYYDQLGLSYQGISIIKKNTVETDDRIFILKFLFPKKLETRYFIDIELTERTFSDDVLGKKSLPLFFVMTHHKLKIKFQLTFNSDISDNCRP